MGEQDRRSPGENVVGDRLSQIGGCQDLFGGLASLSQEGGECSVIGSKYRKIGAAGISRRQKAVGSSSRSTGMGRLIFTARRAWRSGAKERRKVRDRHAK